MPPASASVVVVPTYNEAENIAEFLRRVRAANPDVDVLVVDDSSPDGTADLARAAGEEVGRVDIALRAEKTGLGGAYRHGFGIVLARGYEHVVQMDADLSHDPAAVPALLRAVRGDAGLAIGSRYVPGGTIPNWPWHRRALSKYGNKYTQFVLGAGIADMTAGFRAWKAETLRTIDAVDTTASGYLFQIEMAYRARRAGVRIVEVPINFRDRERGTSKMSTSVVTEAMATVTWWGLRDRVFRRKAAR